MKYYVIKVDERSGGLESPFSHFTGIATAESGPALEDRLREILKTWYGRREKAEILSNDDLFGIYQFRYGEIRLRGWTEIPEIEYNILKKYFIEL